MIMIAVSSNNTVEEMSGISIPTVHTFIQQELGDAQNLAEAEVDQLQSIYEYGTIPNVEIIEETREEITWWALFCALMI